MTGDVPKGAQCTAAGCEREAVNPEHPAGFCEGHQPRSGEDADLGEQPTEENGREYIAPPSGRTFYPDWIQERDWWIDWVLAKPFSEDGAVDWDATSTKQPVTPYRNGRADPSKWNFGLLDDEHPCTDFETVQRWAGWKIGSEVPAHERVVSEEIGTGIIIPPAQEPDQTLTLIDWDNVRDPETGEVHPVVAAAIEEVDAYAEISQSGEGIHQFVLGAIPGGFKKFIRHIDDKPFVDDDRPQVEMYQSGRVCAMTGRHVEGSGEDVADGQALIDELCWRFGTATNNAEGSPTDPFATQRQDDSAASAVPNHEQVGNALQEAAEYDGPAPVEWDVPEGRSVEYHAVLRARERSDRFDVANWELIGYAAALGSRDGLSKEEIKEDLRDHPTPQYGYDESRAEKEVRGVHRKVENGNYEPQTVDKLAQRGVLPPEFVKDGGSDGEEYRPDPREIEATVDPRRAWDTAGRVTPEDLPGDALAAAGEAFACPQCGEAVDVVRAAAVDSGLVESCETSLEEEYPEAYRRARETYDAPLPEYYTEADAIAEYDAVLDVIAEAGFFDLETDALESEITERGDEVGGDAVRALDPAWRDSESGASVLVFPSGTVWDADTEKTIVGGRKDSLLRFIALDSGLIDNPDESLKDSLYTEAYRRLREEYNAPVPRWEPASDGSRQVTPQLPPSEELTGSVDLDGVAPDALEQAREDVEALVAEATAEADTPTVVTALPATGKTTGTVKTAREQPLSYLAPRKELQQQALEKAERWGVDARVCPVFYRGAGRGGGSRGRGLTRPRAGQRSASRPLGDSRRRVRRPRRRRGARPGRHLRGGRRGGWLPGATDV